MEKKLLLVVNPQAGVLRARRELLGIVKTLSDADFSVQVYTTRDRKDASAYVEAHANEFDLIAACGGDGTVNETISGAIRANFGGVIGVLPCGTTNDLAISLNLPRNVPKASRLIAEGNAKFLDMGAFHTDTYFTYVASFGAFTEVAYSTDQKSKNLFGPLAYLAEGLVSLADIKPYRMRVACNGEVYEDDFIFGAVLNALSVGGIMKLRKSDVSLADGKHEVLLIRNPKTAAELAMIFRDIMAGVFNGTGILLLHTDKVRFECAEKVAWTVDGEYAGALEKVEIRTLHNKLKIVRP